MDKHGDDRTWSDAGTRAARARTEVGERLSGTTGKPPAKAPAERALRWVERHNLRARHENAGFLSAERGFLPKQNPLTRLPPRFAAWDHLAAELPSLYRTLSVRRAVKALPLLDASAEVLPDRELLRAASLLAILSHAYWYVDSRPPDGLPEVLRRPWAEVRARLGRSQEVISYIDLIVYNWRLRDARPGAPLSLENMELLFPTIGNQEERVFYLTQVEILARTSPVVRLAAAAQGAVVREDDEELEAALSGIIECLGRMVGSSLPKINPNPYARSHVDPVVWAKTVAPFAVPIHRGDQGPSGTSSPVFNTLDIFFGRRSFASFLGREIRQLRGTYPPAWRLYLRALDRVSVGRYVAARGRSALRGAYQEAFELYAGESGFLGRHRMKVYGFLELAFKVGRSVTIGGFGGVFTDRTWDLVDDALGESQSERTRELPSAVHRAKVARVDPPESDARAGVRRVTLDISGAGVRYRSGDRCLVLPENEPALVARTLRALGARGAEPVLLSEEWRAYARSRAELAGRSVVTLGELLRFGAIRPVSPRLAEALHARTQSPLLYDAILRGATERWELWELLAVLRAHGVTPRGLGLDTDDPTSDALSRLIPPQRFRVYSVSSAPQSPLRKAESTLELTVGQLRYTAPELPGVTDAALDEPRVGTGSTFLIRAHARGLEVPFRIEHPEVFRLPEDPATPVVMFAAGSGIAPFRAFVEERSRTSLSGPSWLFLSLRGPEDFPRPGELGALVERGQLRLEVAFTRTGAALATAPDGRCVLTDGPTRRIHELMLAKGTAEQLALLARPREQGGGAMFYICGRSGFAESVMRALELVLLRHGPQGATEAWAREQLYRMVGDRRLIQETHSDAQPIEEKPRLFDVSEIAEHNDAEHGYWIVIDRVVYDMTEFMELHPGGRRVVQAYAGMDATHGFARAHYNRADVDAMRETYRIGLVRTLHFEDYVVSVDAPAGATAIDCSAAYRAFAKALQLVVEMQNALVADQSLFLREGAQGEYVVLRAVETHRRFLNSYFGVLSAESLPELWRTAQALFFPELPPDWLARCMAELAASDEAHATEALAVEAFEQLERFEPMALAQLAARCAELDRFFLADVKRALLVAVRAFERLGPRVRTEGASRIRRACVLGAASVRRYYRRASRAGAAEGAERGGRAGLIPSGAASGVPVRRVHTGVHWTLDEYPAERLALLRRTPIAVVSLPALVAENEQVLACLREAHRSFGLVVDTRQARLRNDIGFEDAMAKLRHELTAHFRRTAVLLESTIGELQVNRIERDERRSAIATRSESTAFKFAQGAELP